MKGGAPEIKPPKFLTDLYRDLRDQRLLPIVVLLLVAIPVVPFLLSDPTPTFVPPAADDGVSATVSDDSLMVVSAPAGLRRHGERFAERTPRDPFVDPNAPEPTAAGQAGGTESTTGAGGAVLGTDTGDIVAPTTPSFDDPGSTGDGIGSPASINPDGSHGSGGSGSGSEPQPDSLRLFRLKTTVRFGKAGSGLLHTFEDIDRMRGLPFEQPIAVFIGASDDGGRAVFSISADASLVSGKGSCSSGRPKNCQFLTLRPGQAANITDARRGVVWRLGVNSIELVESQVKVAQEGPDARRTDKDEVGSGPAAEPIDPEVVEAASLSEVIGLYLLK